MVSYVKEQGKTIKLREVKWVKYEIISDWTSTYYQSGILKRPIMNKKGGQAIHSTSLKGIVQQIQRHQQKEIQDHLS